MNEVLIKGGRIVTGVDDYGADILIRNGKIETIGRALGVELRLLLLFDGGVKTGKISINRFVQLLSTALAKMFGLFPTKGAIAIGSDADLVLFDPNKQYTMSASTHHSNVDYSLYEGRSVTGQVEKVFLRGELIVNGAHWLGRKGKGKYLKRSASGVF